MLNMHLAVDGCCHVDNSVYKLLTLLLAQLQHEPETMYIDTFVHVKY